jgi:hypothetical protein
MKISDKTFDVLKNFATINSSIMVRAGNVVRAVSEQKNILAKAVVDESFPQQFAIYELNRFLGLASLFEDADYDFQDKWVQIKEGTNESRFVFIDPTMVTAAPDKDIELPSTEVYFRLMYSDLKKVINAANQLELPEVVVRGKNGHVHLVATDTKNSTPNEFSHDLRMSASADFDFVFKVENFKLMAQDYDVKISKRGLSHFKGDNIEYWVATETGSNYNG